MDALIHHDTVAARWELGMRFQKALHRGAAIEPTAGIAFKRFPDDGRQRFVGHEHFAAARSPRIAIPDRGLEHPIAVERPRPHAVHGLLAVLLALMLGDTGEKMLDELTIRILAELDRRRFQNAARARDLGPQLQMGFQPARKSADVVNDDDMRLLTVGAQMGEHRLHAGPSYDAARHIILEDLRDAIAAIFRELAAARFLAG